MGISQSQNIEFIPPKDVYVSKKVDCSICFDQLDENVVMLRCKHLFHKQCINEWGKDHNTCPLCRCENAIRAPAALDLNHEIFETEDFYGGISYNDEMIFMAAFRRGRGPIYN